MNMATPFYSQAVFVDIKLYCVVENFGEFGDSLQIRLIQLLLASEKSKGLCFELTKKFSPAKVFYSTVLMPYPTPRHF